MKTDKNILIAFLLNLSFSIFELVGGAITGSVAIVSDAFHDLGDAVSIGLSYFLERKSRKQPDTTYTYGYTRYSVLGSAVTTGILLLGSILVIGNAISRILNPVDIHYDGMILFAVIGTVTNLAAAWFTRDGDSLNQKAVNLHMLEDVLGWLVVLVGAIVMRFTDITILDPILSIGVALFILHHALRNLKELLDIFLEKVPENVNLPLILSELHALPGVQDVHHVHLRSTDGIHLFATMHIVTDQDHHHTKDLVRQILTAHGIAHATLELESPDEHCHDRSCQIDNIPHHHHHHHHG